MSGRRACTAATAARTSRRASSSAGRSAASGSHIGAVDRELGDEFAHRVAQLPAGVVTLTPVLLVADRWPATR